MSLPGSFTQPLHHSPHCGPLCYSQLLYKKTSHHCSSPTGWMDARTCVHAKSLSRFSRVQLFVMLWTVPARLLCPWDSPGKNIGVGCHAHLQSYLPNPRIEPGSPTLQADCLLYILHYSVLHCRQILYCWATRETPRCQDMVTLTAHSCQWADSEKRLLFQDAFPLYCPFFNSMKYHHTRLNSYIDF